MVHFCWIVRNRLRIDSESLQGEPAHPSGAHHYWRGLGQFPSWDKLRRQIVSLTPPTISKSDPPSFKKIGWNPPKMHQTQGGQPLSARIQPPVLEHFWRPPMWILWRHNLASQAGWVVGCWVPWVCRKIHVLLLVEAISWLNLWGMRFTLHELVFCQNWLIVISYLWNFKNSLELRSQMISSHRSLEFWGCWLARLKYGLAYFLMIWACMWHRHNSMSSPDRWFQVGRAWSKPRQTVRVKTRGWCGGWWFAGPPWEQSVVNFSGEPSGWVFPLLREYLLCGLLHQLDLTMANEMPGSH